MGLIGNHSILNKSYAKNYGGPSDPLTFSHNNFSNLRSSSVLRTRSLFYKNFAFPTGYAGGSAFIMSVSSGELSAVKIEGTTTITATGLSAMIAAANSIAGTSSLVGNANAIGLLVLSGAANGAASVVGAMSATSSLSGVTIGAATVVANLGAVIPMSGSVDAVASALVNLKGIAKAAGLVTIGGTGYLSNDDVERLASAVWDEASASHLTSGSTGKALSDAGSAGNPWSAPLAGNNTAGTFGWFVQKLLTVAKFIGLK